MADIPVVRRRCHRCASCARAAAVGAQNEALNAARQAVPKVPSIHVSVPQIVTAADLGTQSNMGEVSDIDRSGSTEYRRQPPEFFRTFGTVRTEEIIMTPVIVRSWWRRGILEWLFGKKEARKPGLDNRGS